MPMDVLLKSVRSACPHDCPDTCAWQVTVENGRATQLVVTPSTLLRAAACAPRSITTWNASTAPIASSTRCGE